MAMRAVALALVLSVASPAVMAAICELSCLQGLHHAAGEAYAHDCHGEAATDTDGPVASSAGGALCHDDGEGPRAARVVAATASPLAAGIVPATVFARVDPVMLRALPGDTRARPPDLLQLTTQLRI